MPEFVRVEPSWPRGRRVVLALTVVEGGGPLDLLRTRPARRAPATASPSRPAGRP